MPTLLDKIANRFGYSKSLPTDIYSVGESYSPFSSLGYSGDKDEMLKHYSSWVYACVSIIAKATSKARFRLYLNRGADELEEIPSHPIIDLIENPNPFDTKTEFLYRAVSHIQLTGDSFIYLAKNKFGSVKEMYVLQPEKIEIVPDAVDFISSYLLNDLKQKEEFKVDEILHFKLPSPNSPYYGASPLMACAMSVDIDEYQHKYQMKFYQNSAIPPIVLETEQGLDEASVKRLRRDWERLHRSDGNSGRTAILERGLKVKSVGISPRELDWLSSNRMTRDDILSIYGVPPALLGLVEDSNRSNGETQEYTFHRQVIEPLLCLIDDKLTKNIASKFDKKFVIRHDSTVPYDAERGARAAQTRILSGQTTINEERLSQGYKPVEGGEEILVPLNYALLSNVSNGIMSDGKNIPQGVEIQSTSEAGKP